MNLSIFIVVLLTVLCSLLSVIGTTNAQSPNQNQQLIDGSTLTSNVCYSASVNLRRDQIQINSAPTSTITVLRLPSATKTIVSCLDLIEVQTGPTTPSDLCSAKSALQLCSGPLGSSSNQHTTCTEINSFYTSPKTVITEGTVNGDEKEWSIKYDGTRYNNFCFPRNVQVIVYSTTEGETEGSLALLIIMILICTSVLICGVCYFWYQHTRRDAKQEFDNAINVMPGGGRIKYDNDEIYDENGNRIGQDGDEDQQQQEDQQPPGLPSMQQETLDREMFGFTEDMSPRNNINGNTRSNNNYVADDGPQVLTAGPIASIYGGDVQQDFASVGRTTHGRSSITNANNDNQRQKPRSYYHVLPEVNTCPLPPLNHENVEQLNSPGTTSTQQQQQQQARVEPSQSQASYTNNDGQDNNDDNGDEKVTICADCGVNVDDQNCPQTCEVTGKAHF